ncbi:bacillithiol biosynthesis deacetylase BshB1 [bacterium]|nr:bacillithiol biosynthesis deacetylase BshB1 [bacterium]
MRVDVLAIGAHPDDVELTIGGTIAGLVRRGKRVAVIDMTRGEMGTRGTPEQRSKEAATAAEILGLTERINLDMDDGYLANTLENRRKLIAEIRRLRPKIVLAHHWNDLHPDHCAVAEMVKDTMYPIGMPKYQAEGKPYRPNEVLFYMGHFPFEPNLIVDVSEDMETKMAACRCYQSQLFKPDSSEIETSIAQPDFLDHLVARARHYGLQILKTYGEPFAVRRCVPVLDLVDHYAAFPKR